LAKKNQNYWIMSATAPVNAGASASATSGPSKAAMMFMRASNKAQQDKGKDLSVSLDSIKAELAGFWARASGFYFAADI
jgi:hypothetical protein